MRRNCSVFGVIRSPARVRFVFSYENTFIILRVQLFTVHLEYSSESIMKYNLDIRVFIYDNFVKHETWRTVVTNFRHSFPDSSEPSKAMIYDLLKKFRTTRSPDLNLSDFYL